MGRVLEGGKAPVGLQGVRRVDGRSLGRDLGNLSFEKDKLLNETCLNLFLGVSELSEFTQKDKLAPGIC
jgi:hypothetical protein